MAYAAVATNRNGFVNFIHDGDKDTVLHSGGSGLKILPAHMNEDTSLKLQAGSVNIKNMGTLKFQGADDSDHGSISCTKNTNGDRVLTVDTDEVNIDRLLVEDAEITLLEATDVTITNLLEAANALITGGVNAHVLNSNYSKVNDNLTIGASAATGASLLSIKPFNVAAPTSTSHSGFALLIGGSPEQVSGADSAALAMTFDRVNDKGILQCIAPTSRWCDFEYWALEHRFYYLGNLRGKVDNSGFVNTSDERLKTDIQLLDTESSLQKVLQAVPKRYKWKISDDNGMMDQEEKDKYHVGLIAQEVMVSNPHCVSLGKDDIYGIQYNDYIIHLIGAVQQMHARITYLEEQLVQVHQTQIYELQQQVAQLQAAI